MAEELRNDGGIDDGGDERQGTATMGAVFEIDIESQAQG